MQFAIKWTAGIPFIFRSYKTAQVHKIAQYTLMFDLSIFLRNKERVIVKLPLIADAALLHFLLQYVSQNAYVILRCIRRIGDNVEN